MATIGDIGVAAAFNIISALIFLIAFAILRLQPVNDRVYFAKWYIKGLRTSPTASGTFVRKFVNLDYRSYIKFLNWVPDALTMPEAELIDHAGLDSAVYLRIYLLGYATSLLLPESSKEYETIANMRFYFLQSEKHRPDQFTVLVKNVPPDAHESVSEMVQHFFLVNHHDNYLTHQVVCNANKLAKLVKTKQKKQNWLDYYQIKYTKDPSKRPMMKTGFHGLWGAKVDAIEHHETEIEKLSNQIAEERKNVMNNPKAIMPAAFVSFKTRWGAAVCAQTQQARNPTLWLTEWAPEPRDVYWKNLAIPHVSLIIRKVTMGVAKPIKSFIQGFLPGIALKIFLILLPKILMAMSKFEGFLSKSRLERRSASRYYLFNFVNVFLGSIIAGAAFEQLNTFLNQSANRIPETIGIAIPMKATFFITYIMVDGWSGTAGEILRLKPLVIYHLKNIFLVKTERDREKAMHPGTIGFNTGEPQIQFYFLIGLVYAVVTPLLIPFILVFFGLAFVVFRHQIINVYNPKYESRAAFWPDVHGRVITALIISQVLLMGLLSTKHAAASTPVLLALPVLTIGFHMYCKGRFEPAFTRYPLQEAINKDTLDRVREPNLNLNLKGYLENAYIHPVFKDDDFDDEDALHLDDRATMVPTKRQSRQNTPTASKTSNASEPSHPEIIEEKHKP
ncbi:protein of unknown function DUF221 [Cynara cardunculus var. scolymus]|uniref:Uncharacterized protein n=1 Tax=Cynara cardunculus var. scolymus TaxID=59895 RepID=A0A103YHU4_CYNCS|nr:protein of unknown function DUF221 [Cynara cardunculus var. scolymus]